eukprot:2389190-Prymnesium_polylepis.1
MGGAKRGWAAAWLRGCVAVCLACVAMAYVAVWLACVWLACGLRGRGLRGAFACGVCVACVWAFACGPCGVACVWLVCGLCVACVWLVCGLYVACVWGGLLCGWLAHQLLASSGVRPPASRWSWRPIEASGSARRHAPWAWRVAKRASSDGETSE